MKVKIQIDRDLSEEFVEFHVRAISDEVSRFAEIIEKGNQVLTGIDECDRIAIIQPEEIISFCAEKKWCRIHMADANYSCRKRLYELKSLLGPDYVRISKSIVVNIRKISSVEAVFNGMLLLYMKDGSKEYVSRYYLSDIKACLGI